MVAISIGALWLKWSLGSFDSWGWPADFGRTIAALFVTGVVLAFAAAATSSVTLRRTLQAIAALSLIVMLLVPIDVDRWLPAPRYKYRHDDRFVSLAAKPQVEHNQYGDAVVLQSPDTSEPPISIYVWRELMSQIPADRAVNFTLWRTRDVLLSGWRVEGRVPPWDDRLETVRVDGRTVYDARICLVHHVTMQRMELPIHYGLPAYDEAWEKFSGGPGFVQGGCVVTPQRTEMGYRCAACAEQYEKWVAELTRRNAARKRETSAVR